MMGRIPWNERFEDGTDSDIEIVNEAMRMTGVEGMADRPIDQLSGGERQRVIIASALAQSPKILLLDEPTLHLDIDHQLELMDLISTFAREERLIVMIVTHDLGLAARYCDKIVLMDKGKVQAAGRVAEALTSANMAKVFGIEASLYLDERTGAYNVAVIRPLAGRNDR